MQDTYAAQLAAMQRMLQCIEDDELEAELDKLCSPPFLEWLRAVLPRSEAIVNRMANRAGVPLINLLVQRASASKEG